MVAEPREAVTIGVWPFEHADNDSEQSCFAHGFVDELTRNLTRFALLGVLHPRTTQILADASATGKETPAAAAADYRLMGRVRRDGERLRVSAQLEEVGSGRQLWAERYDALITDSLEVQDDIAAAVAASLAIRIDRAQLGRARRKPTNNLEAYDCWLRGMDHLRRGTVVDDEEARGFFEQAIDLDPHYARAHVGVSLSFFNEWSCQAWERWDENERRAFAAAERAAAITDDDAMVHIVLARVHLYRREFGECDRHVARALELNPNEADVLAQAALCKAYLGDGATGAELGRKAQRLNPFHDDWYVACVALPMLIARDEEAGVEAALQAPGATVDTPAYLAGGYARLGDQANARVYMEQFLDGFRSRITFGREPDAGEPLRWVLHVNPFRRQEDADYLAESLRLAGLSADPDLDRLPTAAAVPSKQDEGASGLFRRDGDAWVMAFADHSVRLTPVKGFVDIATLLARPGREVHCLELAGRPVEDGGEVLDATAREQLRRRVRDLQEELDEAERNHDRGRLELARREMDALVDELGGALGLSGRPRRVGNGAERARSAVTWRIRSAIGKISDAHPRLGRHLANSLRTGVFCVYEPESDFDWTL